MTQAIIVKREGAYVVTAAGAEVVASLLAQAKAALEDIQPVLDDLENVNTVADNIADVNTVAARDADISTVAARDTDIGTVATNVADVQTVATNIVDVTTCADNMAAILAAPDAAADALSAAGSVYVTSYSHEFSVGDRTTTAVADGGSFTTGLTVSGGTINNLIDGATTNNNTDAVLWASAQAVTGLAYFQWVFPSGRSLICDELVIKNSGTQANGNGKAQLLKHDGTWVDAGSAVAAGGAATVTVSVAGPDKGGYAGIRFLGTSSTTQTTGRTLEVEFKLANGALDGNIRVPAGMSRGQVALQGPNTGQLVAAKPIDYNAAAIAGAGLLGEWFFNEGSGETVYDQSGLGQHIVFDSSHRSTYGGALGTNYDWTPQGLLLRKAMVQTPSLASVKEYVVLMIPTREDGSNLQVNLSATTSINAAYIRNADTHGTATVNVGNGGLAVTPLVRHVNAGSGTVGHKLNRGGPVLAFVSPASVISGRIGLGGQCLVTSDTDRATLMTVVYLAAYSTLLSDDNRTSIRSGLRRACAVRGVFIDWRDCKTFVNCTLNWGQSNNEGDALLTELTAARQAKAFVPRAYILAAAQSDQFYYPRASRLFMGRNNYPAAEGTKFGTEMGLAWAYELGDHAQELAICKVGASGSILGGPNEGLSATALQWNAAVPKNVGLLWFALARWFDMEQQFLAEGIGPRLRALNWTHGETDSGSTAVDAQSENYDDNLQGLYDAVKTATTYTDLKANITELRAWHAGSPLNQTRVGTTRTRQADFVTANSATATLIDADDSTTDAYGQTYGFRADGLHYNAALLSLIGERQHTNTVWL